MSYVAPDPEAYLNQVVGDGQCVAYVKKAAGCPATARWSEGMKVKDGNVPQGTAIAVFQDGTYNNYTDGRSHAAILISETPEGLKVYDQWLGQVVHERTIRFKGGAGNPVNDGDAFSVIEDRAVLTGSAKMRLRRERSAGPSAEATKREKEK